MPTYSSSNSPDEQFTYRRKRKNLSSSPNSSKVKPPSPKKVKVKSPSPQENILETKSHVSNNNIQADLTFTNTISKSKLKKIVNEFLLPYTIRVSNNISHRIKYAKYIINYIKNINKETCLTKYNNAFLLGDKILLSNKIGSNSCFGIIYKTVLEYNFLFRVASKIMPLNRNNKKEIDISLITSKQVLDNKNPHFLISYGYFTCNNIQNIDDTTHDIMKNNYYIFLNELANGDLYNFIDDFNIKKYNNSNLYNTLFQIFISIYSFQKLYYIHNDCHFGNFLYHKVKKGGYIHYKINNIDYYLKNNGFLWCIWDFSLIEALDDEINYNIDYNRIIDNITINNIKKINNVGFNNFCNSIKPNLIIYKNNNEYISYFMNQLMIINNDYKIFYDGIPDNNLIINKTPYIIG